MKNALLAVFVSLVLTGVCHAQALTPAQLAQEIDRQGAKATVRHLDHDGRFDAVLSGIASGNPAWIQLAPQVAAGSDAGDSTGLSIALARALPKNPPAVLRVLDDSSITGVDAVCSVPFIEPTLNEVRTYVSKASAAIRRVPKSDRFPRRDACLDALSRAERSATSR